jgi:hypothetical protein
MEDIMNGLILRAMPVGAAMLLAACGGSGDKAAQQSEASSASATWNATDACTLLDKADLGAALNDNVTKTRLGFVSEAAGPNAATSECTYELASGSTATLMARWSPISDNTPEAIATARNAAEASVKAFGKTIEDVPDLGKAAFFIPGINQMNVFIDKDKFVILTIGSAPNGTAKATAISLIDKIEK